MRDRAIYLNTLAEVITFLIDRIVLDETPPLFTPKRFGIGQIRGIGDTPKRCWLESGSGYYSRQTYHIPADVFNTLAQGWGRGNYNDFAGTRGAKRILADLGVSKQEVRERVDSILAEKAEKIEERQREYRVKTLDEFIAEHGWISTDLKVALENEMIGLAG